MHIPPSMGADVLGNPSTPPLTLRFCCDDRLPTFTNVQATDMNALEKVINKYQLCTNIQWMPILPRTRSIVCGTVFWYGLVCCVAVRPVVQYRRTLLFESSQSRSFHWTGPPAQA
ncbi:hypothetical protein GGR58DRAFT_491119 [Xylaria digitata]|nr:hypothetical protein GGR58DRAFT_491119 [Xylaria digitata]